MQRGTPYYEFLIHYRQFLKDHKFESPSELHRAVVNAFTKRKWEVPSLSQFWEAFYGRGTLSKPVLGWLGERYKWYPPTESFFTVNVDGVMGKFNKIKVPGQRELKFRYVE